MGCNMDKKQIAPISGCGYVVVEADGDIRKFVVADQSSNINTSILTKNIRGGFEPYCGNAGDLVEWCSKRGLVCEMYKLQAVPDDAKEG